MADEQLHPAARVEGASGSSAPPPDGESRVLSRAAALIAAGGAAWFVFDRFWTDSRVDALWEKQLPDAEWQRGFADLGRGHDLRQLILLGVTALAIGLAVAALRRAPSRRRRIANGIGVAAVLWMVVVGATLLFGPDDLPGGGAETTIALSVGLGLLTAFLTWFAVGRGGEPTGERGRFARALPPVGFAAVGVSAIATVVWLAGLSRCGEPESTEELVVFAIAAIVGFAAVAIGIVATLARRWMVGLFVIAGAVASLATLLIGVLRCLE